jgi:ABC-type polysaccharide/polyol phosphate transport system ATPase subunit
MMFESLVNSSEGGVYIIDEYVNVSPFSFMHKDSERTDKFLKLFNQGITIVPVVDEQKKILSIITINGEINAS